MGIDKSNIEIAEEAIYIEREILNEIVGAQDQYTTAVGGIVFLDLQKEFIKCKKINVNNIQIKKLEKRLHIYFTGITRYSQLVLKEQNKRNELGQNDVALNRMKELTDEFLNILNCGDDIDKIGNMLHENWNLKKGLASSVSNIEINEMYQSALQAGATGGKLLGAGAGGFLMIYVPENFQSNVSQKLSKYKKIDFNFEESGSKIGIINNLFE